MEPMCLRSENWDGDETYMMVVPCLKGDEIKAHIKLSLPDPDAEVAFITHKLDNLTGPIIGILKRNYGIGDEEFQDYVFMARYLKMVDGKFQPKNICDAEKN